MRATVRVSQEVRVRVGGRVRRWLGGVRAKGLWFRFLVRFAFSVCIQHNERIRSGSGFSMKFGPVRMMQFTWHIWLASHTMTSLHMQKGHTALLLAAMKGRFDTVKLLLARGARIEHQDKVPRD